MAWAQSHDAYTGLLTSFTDPNQQMTTYAYTDGANTDPLDRLLKVTRPDGGRTRYTYAPAHDYVTTTEDQEANDSKIVSQAQFDGLGRTTAALTFEDSDSASSNYISVDTEYDFMGRPRRVSQPYRTGETTYWATTTYDALGRPLDVTTGDTATATTRYSLNTTTVTDPASTARTMTYDALGRLTDVTEAGSAQTHYSYDGLGNLAAVCQGGTVQAENPCQSGIARSFTYDWLGRLGSATNPETGTISYVYYDNGNLQTKTDARNIVTSMTYDALDRITFKSYSDGAPPSVRYCYGQNGPA